MNPEKHPLKLTSLSLFACIFSLLLLPAILLADGETPLLLADGGKTQYVIVESGNPTPAEKKAAQELKLHLQKVTGAAFRIQTESASSKPPAAIYVGQTRFAARNGIDFAKLDGEEWNIRTVGRDLILCGGRPRGSLYAVYEFLEQQIGCRWFDEFMESIPVRKKLAVRPLSVQARPVFFGRQIGMGKPISRDCPELIALRARNKDTRTTGGADYGYGEGVTSHNFYQFSKRFPAGHPEYLAMNYDGSRPVSVSGSGPGQICLTNPGARKSVLEQMRANLKERYRKNPGLKRTVYPLVPNDKAWSCQCPECLKIVRREKAESGALLDFVNAIARELRSEFPDVLIATTAYMNNILPPLHIRPESNVMIEIAQLNGEWATTAKMRREYPDMFRPLSHPVNSEARRIFETWANISNYLETWDYWVEWTDKFPTPYVLLRTIASDIRFFRKCKVRRIYVEQEYSQNYPCFHALTTWVGWKLMQDPDRDLDRLVKIFMDGYYGPAAGKMTELLEHMEKSIAAVPAKAGSMSVLTPSKRPYLTLEFYRIGQNLLDEAEKLCPADSRYLLNVQKERIPFDAGLYCMWNQLKKQLKKGESMPWNPADILKRYQVNRLNQARVRWPSSYKKTVSRVEKEAAFFKGLAADRAGRRPPILAVPWQNCSPSGQLDRVDWSKAAASPVWLSLSGAGQPAGSIRAFFTRDADHLYFMLEEKGADPAKLSNRWWSGDIYELFMSVRRNGNPYKQLAFNSANESYAYEYGEKQSGWKIAGLKSVSEIKNGVWRLRAALPLRALMTPEQIGSGCPVFLNIFRKITAQGITMCLSPIYEAGYRDMTRLVELRLDPRWPDEKQNLFRGKSYTLSTMPNYKLCSDPETELQKLTDGQFVPAGRPLWLQKKYTVGFTGIKPEITVDLGSSQTVNAVYYHTGAGLAGVEPPTLIKVFAGSDPQQLRQVGEVRPESTLASGYRSMTIRIPVKECSARYIRIAVSGKYYIFCDEIAAMGGGR